MNIRTLCTGSILTWKHLLVRNAPQGIRFEVPVKCFYIEHDGHKLLFDAGQKPLSYQQPDDANYLVKVTPAETAAALLRQTGVSPEDIDHIVLSHLHSDHAAGIVDFPQATLLMQSKEYAIKNPGDHKKLLLDGEYDIFGDGRLIVLPTYGHTAGHQSLLATLDDSSRVLLTGDAAYTIEALNCDFSDADHQRDPEFFNTVKQLRQMQQNSIKLIFSHE